MDFKIAIKYQLEHFTLTVNEEWSAFSTGLFGPSGSGKTSLLKALLGVAKPQFLSGQIILDGKTLFDSTRRFFELPQARRLGWVPQDAALFPHMTVRENLVYASGKNDYFLKVVRMLNLDFLLDRYPRRLSGGEKQRVALGRALLAEVTLLLLDEPFSSLDSYMRDEAQELLKHVQNEFKIPMILVSHDWQSITSLCQVTLHLRGGAVTRLETFAP